MVAGKRYNAKYIHMYNPKNYYHRPQTHYSSLKIADAVVLDSLYIMLHGTVNAHRHGIIGNYRDLFFYHRIQKERISEYMNMCWIPLLERLCWNADKQNRVWVRLEDRSTRNVREERQQF